MKQVHLSELKEKEQQNALNEIRFLASLNHHNVIGYKDVFINESS